MTSSPSLTNRQIGHRIQFARIQSSYSTVRLADLAGITESQLRSFEADEDLISGVELMAVASAMRLPVEYFTDPGVPIDGMDKWRLIDAFRKLEPAERQRILQLVMDLADGTVLTA